MIVNEHISYLCNFGRNCQTQRQAVLQDQLRTGWKNEERHWDGEPSAFIGPSSIVV